MTLSARPAIRLLPLLALLSAAAHAEWTLDPQGSSLHYVTTKAGAVSEINGFDRLSGAIDAQGRASLVIDLASVNTAIPVRDERMRDILFKVADNPSATVSLNVPAEELQAMSAGRSSQRSIVAELSLMGVTETLDAEVYVTKLADGGLLIQNTRPILVSAQPFGLEAGVEELREVAGLNSITPSVVVNFALRYASGTGN